MCETMVLSPHEATSLVCDIPTSIVGTLYTTSNGLGGNAFQNKLCINIGLCRVGLIWVLTHAHKYTPQFF